ncbi:hypothetical protein HZA56_10730 [Candidatus Poribacteria bacterium]|nr:hypothetical protein [Candidatus Poribacteria bacterium]
MRNAAIFALSVCLVAICSCAQTKSVKIYEDLRTGVALRKVIPRDAPSSMPPYSHPFSFQLEDLKFLLSTIGYSEKGFFGWSEAPRVFSAEELYRLTPHLVQAFERAAPEEEVLFHLTTAKPGMVFASDRFTSGAMFVKDKKLNCLFANVNIRPHVTEAQDGDPRIYYSGALWRLAKGEWQTLFEDEKGTHHNWIVLDIEAGLAEKKRVDQSVRQELRRRVFRKRPAEGTDWQDWQPDEWIPPR